MRSKTLIALALAVSLVCGSHASAAVVAITATDDGTIFDNPTRDGVFDSLNTTASQIDVVLVTSSEWRGVAEFSLAGVPSGSVINSATLSMSAGGGIDDGTMVAIGGFFGNGVVELADATTATTFLGTHDGTDSNLDLSLDVTAFVQSATNANQGFAGFRLDPTTQTGGAGFYSIDSTVIPPPPTLTIDFAPGASNAIPEPSTLALSALGLMSLGFAGRRRRRR